MLYLRRTALGEAIEQVIITAPNMIKTSSGASFARALAGRRMVEAYRRGKYLITTLDDNRALILHFGMGGDLSYYRSARDRPEFTRIEFIFKSGWRLAFTCPRKICRVMLVDKVADLPALRDMGPEPLDSAFSLAHFERLIDEAPSRQIKPLLMDQKLIAGVGNIYADEILFEAGVRPDRRASDLSEDEIKRIHHNTRRVIKKAIRNGGDEVSPSEFLVSRNSRGAACRRCHLLIENKKIAGRTAYFCPHCQL